MKTGIWLWKPAPLGFCGLLSLSSMGTTALNRSATFTLPRAPPHPPCSLWFPKILYSFSRSPQSVLLSSCSVRALLRAQAL